MSLYIQVGHKIKFCENSNTKTDWMVSYLNTTLQVDYFRLDFVERNLACSYREK